MGTFFVGFKNPRRPVPSVSVSLGLNVNAMPEARFPFRKQLLAGERVLHYPIDWPPVQKRTWCQWLSEAFKACFYRRKSPQADERLSIVLPRVRKDCC